MMPAGSPRGCRLTSCAMTQWGWHSGTSWANAPYLPQPVRPLSETDGTLTKMSASVQSTPVQHDGTPAGSTGGLDAERSAGEKPIVTSSSGKIASTPVGGAAVEPGALREVPDTPNTDKCSGDDIPPGSAEVVRPARVNPLSRMTGYVVATFMAILTLVALAGSISCVAVAVSVSRATIWLALAGSPM